jgi:hypothetical protein
MLRKLYLLAMADAGAKSCSASASTRTIFFVGNVAADSDDTAARF